MSPAAVVLIAACVSGTAAGLALWSWHAWRNRRGPAFHPSLVMAERATRRAQRRMASMAVRYGREG